MPGVIIFATGSSILVDVEESLRRAGLRIAAGVRNREGDCWLSDPQLAIGVGDIDASHVALPFIAPLFTPANRRVAVAEARELGFRAALSLIDPSVAAPAAISYGEGLYIGVGCSLGAGSAFGDHTFINRGASIGHHFRGGAFVSVGPGAVLAGHVTLGEGVVVGAGATILPGVSIGANTTVAAGAVVRKNAPGNSLIAGNPGRVARAGRSGKPGG